jgi:hypothetical protein
MSPRSDKIKPHSTFHFKIKPIHKHKTNMYKHKKNETSLLDWVRGWSICNAIKIICS